MIRYPIRSVTIVVVAMTALLAGGLATGPATLHAQEAAEPLAEGMPAPGFALVAATSDGIAADPVRLSDYRGQTLVIAFFFRARTKG